MVVLIVALMRANREDRAQYADLQLRSGANYETDISNQRRRIRELEALLDTCRELRNTERELLHEQRRKIEDDLFEARREILRLTEEYGGGAE